MKSFRKSIVYLILVIVVAVLIFGTLLFRSYQHYKGTSEYLYGYIVSDIMSDVTEIGNVAKVDQQEYTVQQLNALNRTQSDMILEYQKLFLMFGDESFVNATKLEFVDFNAIFAATEIRDWDSSVYADRKVKLDDEAVEQVNRLVEFGERLSAFYVEEKMNEDVGVTEKRVKMFMREIGQLLS